MQPETITTRQVGIHRFRVRYGETDQMGTFYNSRALDWFDCGRTEYMRQLGIGYAQVEADGVFLPVIEAFVTYFGRARYDDLLVMHTSTAMAGKVRVRFDVNINHEDGRPVAKGYTVHAFVDGQGKPIRPPAHLVNIFSGEGSTK